MNQPESSKKCVLDLLPVHVEDEREFRQKMTICVCLNCGELVIIFGHEHRPNKIYKLIRRHGDKFYPLGYAIDTSELARTHYIEDREEYSF
jgi:hypothetical protein